MLWAQRLRWQRHREAWLEDLRHPVRHPFLARHRDELRIDPASGAVALRRTDVWISRWTWEQSRTGDARWSLSGHVAGREDSLEGRALGYGAEIGYRISSKATVTLGYNPRGWSDNEITVEERPRQGVTVRLRFAIEGALSRWLDAGRDDAGLRAGRLDDRLDQLPR